MAKPFSDEGLALRRIIVREGGCKDLSIETKELVAKHEKAIRERETHYLATIDADRQEIENLKLDLDIADRALEIDPATVDLRKRIAELEAEIEVLKTDYQHSHAMRMLDKKVAAKLQAECKRLRDVLKFYANEDNYENIRYDEHVMNPIKTDRGKAAQQALRPKEED